MPEEPEVQEPREEPTDAGDVEQSASWTDVSAAIDQLGAGNDVELPGHRFQMVDGEPTGEDAGAAAEDESTNDTKGAEAGTEEETGKPDSKQEPAEGDAKKPGAEETAKPYAIVGEDGDEYEFEQWPEDAKIRIRADKQDVLLSFDELVQSASMGVHAQARMTQLGNERADAVASRDTALGAVRDLESELDRTEEILRQVLVDDEARDKVRKAAGKYLDREYADGQRAKAELDRRTREESTDAQGAAMQAFWEGCRERVGGQLSEYEFLEEEDADRILSEFQARFERQRDEMYARGDQYAEEKRLDPKDVRAALAPRALAWLTEENLAAVMKEENDRIESRVGPRLQKRDEEEAKRHNERVSNRRKRAGDKPLKGGGAGVQPGAKGAEELQEGENAFDAAKRRIQTELQTARSPLAD